MDIKPEDYKFVPAEPDPDFSPEHNQAVIAETIKKTDLNYRKKDREYQSTIKERSWYIAQYIKGLKLGKAPEDIKKFFSKKDLAYIKGEYILQQLKERGEIVRREKESLAVK